MLLDEWQAVPEVLGAVKRAVDEGSGAGRFLLTGSVRDQLHTQMWPGTGRVIPVRMWGLTVGRSSARHRESLFFRSFVLDFLDAWHSNRLSRLIKAPKRYLVDPSLPASALSVDETAVLRDGSLLGRLIETFVLAQIRPELELARPRSPPPPAPEERPVTRSTCSPSSPAGTSLLSRSVLGAHAR